MPQTVFALIAMVMATILVGRQQRHAAEQRLDILRTEISVQAFGTAVDWLEEIGQTAFDESTAGSGRVTSLAQLTPPIGFGDQDAPINDLDDFDGTVTVIERPVGTDTLRFRAETTVTYSDPDNPSRPMSTPSRYKKVVVRVYSIDVPDPDTVRLWQAYACGHSCTW